MDVFNVILKRMGYMHERFNTEKEFFLSLDICPDKPDKVNAANYLSIYKQLVEFKELCSLYQKINPGDRNFKKVPPKIDKSLSRLERVLISHMAG